MTDDNTQGNVKTLSLSLDERLIKEQIVTQYFYDLETSDLILQLNHEYNGKVVMSVLKLDEWETSSQQFEDKLTLQEISSEHMVLILDTLAANYQAIADFVKGQQQSKGKGRKKSDGSSEQQQKNEFMAFKYSNEGRGDYPLHESVILAGKQAFLNMISRPIK